MLLLRQVLILLFSLYCAWEDWLYRSIPAEAFVVFGCAGLLLLIPEPVMPAALMQALLPGAVCLALMHLTGGQVGRGDAMYLLVAGLYLTWDRILTMLAVSAFLILAAAGVLLLRKGPVALRAETRLPYLTILFPALLCTWLIYLG